MALINGVSYRSKDLEKMEIPWERRDILHTFEDGYTIERILTPADLELEGGIMGHCAGSHAYWVDREVEFMFSLRNPNGVSKGTIHAKPVAEAGKSRPENAEIRNYGGMDQQIEGLSCGYTSNAYDGGYTPESVKNDFRIFKFEDTELFSLAETVRYGDSHEANKAKINEWLDPLTISKPAVRSYY